MNEAAALIAKLTDIESRYGCATVRKEILSMLTLRDFGLGTDFLDYVRAEFVKLKMSNVSFNLILCAIGGWVEGFVYETIVPHMTATPEGHIQVSGKTIEKCGDWDGWRWAVPERSDPRKYVHVFQGNIGATDSVASLVAHEYKEQLRLDGVLAWDPHGCLGLHDMVPGTDIVVLAVDHGPAMKRNLPEGLLGPEERIYRLGPREYGPGHPKFRRTSPMVDNVRFTTRWDIPKDVLEKLEAA